MSDEAEGRVGHYLSETELIYMSDKSPSPIIVLSSTWHSVKPQTLKKATILFCRHIVLFLVMQMQCLLWQTIFNVRRSDIENYPTKKTLKCIQYYLTSDIDIYQIRKVDDKMKWCPL